MNYICNERHDLVIGSAKAGLLQLKIDYLTLI